MNFYPLLFLIMILLFISGIIIIKPLYGVYLIILSVILEGFYFQFFDANIKIPYFLVTIVFIILIFQTFFKKKIKIKYDPFKKIILLIIALHFASVFLAFDKIGCLKSTILNILFASIYFTIISLVNSENKFKTLLFLLMIAIIISSIFGIFQLLGWSVLNVRIPYPNGEGFMSLIEAPRGLRPSAMFVEPDQFGKFSMFVALFFIPFYSNIKQKDFKKQDLNVYLVRKIVNLTVILALISLLITQTRSAWLGFIGGFLYYMTWNIRKHKIQLKPLIKLGVLIIIILIVYYFVSPSTFKNMITRIVGIVDINIGGGSGKTRIDATSAIFNHIISSPLYNIILGFGSGNLNYYAHKFVQLGLWPQYMVELGGRGFSYFLTDWFDIGLVGLIVFFYFILKIYRVNMTVARKIKETNPFLYFVIIGSLSAFTGIFIASMVADSIHVTYFWILLGLNGVTIRLSLMNKNK